MPNHASATLIGHLGRDAETKALHNDNSVVSWSMATTRRRKDKDGNQTEVTTWWRCQMWGKRAQAVAQYLTKGKPVMVQGEVYAREYEGREGEERVSLEVEVRELVLLGGRDDGDERPASPRRETRQAQTPESKPQDHEDPPF